MLKELAALVTEKLSLGIAITLEKEGQVYVTITPKTVDKSFLPFTITGTPDEIDEAFIEKIKEFKGGVEIITGAYADAIKEQVTPAAAPATEKKPEEKKADKQDKPAAKKEDAKKAAAKKKKPELSKAGAGKKAEAATDENEEIEDEDNDENEDETTDEVDTGTDNEQETVQEPAPVVPLVPKGEDNTNSTGWTEIDQSKVSPTIVPETQTPVQQNPDEPFVVAAKTMAAHMPNEILSIPLVDGIDFLDDMKSAVMPDGQLCEIITASNKTKVLMIRPYNNPTYKISVGQGDHILVLGVKADEYGNPAPEEKHAPEPAPKAAPVKEPVQEPAPEPVNEDGSISMFD